MLSSFAMFSSTFDVKHDHDSLGPCLIITEYWVNGEYQGSNWNHSSDLFNCSGTVINVISIYY